MPLAALLAVGRRLERLLLRLLGHRVLLGNTLVEVLLLLLLLLFCRLLWM